MASYENPIAVVGIGCRLPGGASTPSKLWDVLCEGRDLWSPPPPSRFHSRAFYDSNPEAHTNARGGYFLHEDLSAFDGGFFNVTRREAEAMDPQHRLLLECAYEAFENAGLSLEKVNGSRTAVYTSVFNHDYERIQLQDPLDVPFYHMTGVGHAILSNRLSYFFDLLGPSVTLDTGCSGSMVALHLACQSIQIKEADQALVGAPNLILDPAMMDPMSTLRFFSDAGRCFSFDQRATGYGRGEGVAAVILKPLHAARAAGDPIQAVIRATALNQDGRTRGITMPSLDSQVSLIESAYASCHLDPTDTPYFECHGTGTVAGDSVETSAIANVLNKRNRKKNRPVYIGSVKTNVGHMEASSGLGALIKMVKTLEHLQLAPSLNLEQVNSALDLSHKGLTVVDTLTGWPDGSPRRVSINSFGFGGTNAHVVMETLSEYISRESKDNYPSPQRYKQEDKEFSPHDRVFCVTARSQNSLSGALDALLQHILPMTGEHDDEMLASLAYTLGCRRSHLPWRWAVSVPTMEQLAINLKDNRPLIERARSTSTVAFAFTGQGAQWHGMGRELMERYPVFKNSMRETDEILTSIGAPWSLCQKLYDAEVTDDINNANVSQPACTAIQIALVDLLRDWQIAPVSVCGHSSGEIAAAYCAGFLSKGDAVKVAYFRGYSVSELKDSSANPEGSMLAVGLGPAEVDTIISTRLPTKLDGYLGIACINSPSSVTVSGDRSAIESLQRVLNADGAFSRSLRVNVAYHSPHMQSAAETYRQALTELKPHKGQAIAFFSSVTGDLHEQASLDAEYWVWNLTAPVRFSDVLKSMCASTAPPNIILEVGPHNALKSPIMQTLSSLKPSIAELPTYLSTVRRQSNAARDLQEMASQLYIKGAFANMEAVNKVSIGREPRVLIDLPCYQWSHEQYWHEARVSTNYRKRTRPRHELLGILEPASTPIEPLWRNYLRLSELPWLAGHVIEDDVLFPAAGYIAMIVEAATQHHGYHNASNDTSIQYHLKEVNIERAIVIGRESAIETLCSLKPYLNSSRDMVTEWLEFRISSISATGEWFTNCRGLLKTSLLQTECSDLADLGLDPVICSSNQPDADVRAFYDRCRAMALNWDKPFTNIVKAYAGPHGMVAHIDVPDLVCINDKDRCSMPFVHPTVLDAGFQGILMAAFAKQPGLAEGAYVPTFIEEITITSTRSSPSSGHYKSYANIHHVGQRDLVGEIVFYGPVDDEVQPLSSPLLTVRGLTCSRLSTGPQIHRDATNNVVHQLIWVPDIDQMSASRIQHRSLLGLADPNDNHRSDVEMLERIALRYVKAAIEIVSDTNQIPHDHHRKLFAWMQRMVRLDDAGEHAVRPDNIVEIAKHQLALLDRVGPHLSSILIGVEDALSLMVTDRLLDAFYRDAPYQRTYLQIANIVSLMSTKNPSMNVIEIGAGTGGATIPILEHLRRNSVNKKMPLDKWAFTDISNGFFDTAKSALKEWEGLIDYKKLDIESVPSSQEFKGDHDLAIAANVLHATTDIRKTLRNTRALLRPGGKLVLMELTRFRAYIQCIFGTLKGWWLAADDERSFGPLLEPARWCQLLSEEGFEAEVTVLEDHPQQVSNCSVFVATATSCKHSVKSLPVSVFDDDESPLSKQITELVTAPMDTNAAPVTESDLPPLQDVPIILDTSEETLLRRCSDDCFHRLRNFILNNETVVWVARGGNTVECFSIVSGFARTIRSENPHLKLFTLGLPPESHNEISANQVICSIRRILHESEALRYSTAQDYEFQLIEGTLHIPRIVEDKKANLALEAMSGRAEPREQLLHQEHRPLRLVVEKPGLLDSLLFTEYTEAKEPLGVDQILIEVRAVGVNFRDLMVALGQLQASDRMGGECSGVVRAVGSNYASILQPGDHVATWGTHVAYASFTRALGAMTRRIPSEMDFTTAASIPIAFTTAWYALVDKARLSQGDTVLIHSAAGGVGQAAIQIALYFGASVFATVGNDKKRDFLREHYGIDESHIFSSRSAHFASAIRKATNGRGVDVLLNSLSGNLLQESMCCLSVFGTFVEIGKRDILANSRLEMKAFESTRTFTAVNMLDVFDFDPKKGGDLLQEVFDLFQDGKLQVIEPVTVRPMTKIVETFRSLQSGKHIGKFVLEAEPGVLVRATQPKPQKPIFRTDGCYIVSGGLGGLGRQICQWMVECGARHVVTLSRRIPQNVNDFKEALIVLGGELLPLQCNIGKQSEVIEAVGICVRAFGVVHGLFQASLALKDATFDSMTTQNLKDALFPKVTGTINLANALEGQKLEFFVILSSLVGIIGNKAQANYAAGSTFQDGYANRAAKAGVPMLSLNLGAIESAGYVSERPEVLQALIRKGLTSVKLGTLLALISHGIARLKTKDWVSQLLIGLPESAQPANYEDWAFQDPKFSSLVSVNSTGKQEKGRDAGTSIQDALRDVVDQVGAESLICQRVIQRTAALLNTEAGEIKSEADMAKLGLDSLVAVELRNWINQECSCQISVLHLLNASSIKALAASIFASSPLTRNLRQADPKDAEMGGVPGTKAEMADPHQRITPQPRSEMKKLAAHTQIAEQEELVSLPVPLLEDTCARILSSIETISKIAAVERTKGLIEEFLGSGSQGIILQERLLERVESLSHGNWLADMWVSKEYLEPRCPLVPSTSFFALQGNTEKEHTMLERAAVICAAVQRLEDEIITDDLVPDVVGGLVQGMECYRTMFGSHRIPRVGTDVICTSKVQNARHIVVLWKGSFYQIALPQSDDHSVKLYWQSMLSGILESDVRGTSDSIGILTAWNRDDWAKARLSISDVGPSNKALLDTIESASFVLCLDQAAPEDAEGMAQKIWFGNASNRWYDKPLQFIVFSNGRSGFVGEHSILDGRPALRLQDAVTAAIVASDANVDEPPPLDNNYPQSHVHPLQYELTSSLRSSIAQSCADFALHIGNQRLKHVQYHALGRKILEAANLSINTVGHLILMLAAKDYYGRFVSAYDPVSMGHVAGGRFEKCRLATPATKHFIDSMRNPNTSAAMKRESMVAAARAHAGAVADVRAGKGVDGHLLGLRAMVREGEEMPQLLKDKTVAESERWLVSMSYMETHGMLFGFGQVVEGGWGVGFTVLEESMEWMVAARLGEEEMSKVANCILQAAASVKDCLR